ncbi:unnamed protein product [Cyclocybe aegerita]|uniref:F-box domain-containing protein n=1 Tax=Cyclocybe aegerita TaxID=1973307 RepID=A0A8S0WXN0_CYCAE|nr:unnamed protein product [Cyclocybe aegerita]
MVNFSSSPDLPATSSSTMTGAQDVSIEILTEIFHFALEPENPLSLSPFDTRRHISAVCSFWRDVLNSTPSLWQSITFAPTSPQHGEESRALAHAWLQRSRNSLALDFCSRLPPQLPTRVEDLLFGGGAIRIVEEIIRPFAWRIVSLTCILSGCKDDIRAFLTLPPSTFPNLESVNIVFLNDVQNPRSEFTFEERRAFSVFVDAPRLMSARLHLLNGIDPLDLRLPWGQMKLLDFGNIPMADDVFMSIMQMSARSLRDGTFNVVLEPRFHLPLAATFPQISMPNVIRFRLILGRHLADPDLFRLLEFRATKYLQIEKVGGFRGIDLETITPLIRPMSSSLEYVTLLDLEDGTNTIAHSHVYYPEMATIFRAVPGLIYLHLPRGILLDGPLVEDIASGRVLPRLEALDVAVSGLENGYRVIKMADGRNHEALRPAFQASSPSQIFDVAIPRITPIVRLQLQVPLAERNALEELLANFVSSGHLANTVVELVV